MTPDGSPTVSHRYGSLALRTGMLRLIGGKGASALAGIVTLLVIIRTLQPGEFAAYSAMSGLVEVVTALTGLGLAQALLRYVPDLHVRHLDHSLRRLVATLVTVRMGLAAVGSALGLLLGTEMAAFLGLEAFTGELRFFFVLLWVRIALHLLFQVLEALLLQGWAQGVLVAVTLLKFAAVFIVAGRGDLTLKTLLGIECGAELAGAAAFAFVLALHLGRFAFASQGDTRSTAGVWLRENRPRVMSFSVAAYFQHLAILLYGSAPNRLLGARLLQPIGMASLGVALSFADILRRYLPAQLLIGIVRPAMVALYARKRDFGAVAERGALLLRLNGLLLAAPAAVLAVGGDALMKLISDGKYGADAALLLLLFVVVLALESQRLILDVATQVLERMRLLVPTNVLLSLSTLLAIPLFPVLGAACLPAANLIGLVAANEMVRRALEREGHRMPGLWGAILRPCLLVIAASFAGWLVSAGGFGQLVSCTVVLILFLPLAVMLRAVRTADLAVLRGKLWGRDRADSKR